MLKVPFLDKSLKISYLRLQLNLPVTNKLTHWGRVMLICIGKLTIIGSDNGLSPGRRQAIIWTNAGILLIGHLGTNLSEILIGIQNFSFKKMPLKMSSAKWRPFCLGLNELKINKINCLCWWLIVLITTTANTPLPINTCICSLEAF